MANELVVQPAVEFQALPLEYIVAAPLKAAVDAQGAAASATLAYITGLMDKDGKPINIELDATMTQDNADSKSVHIKAPLLAIVPVPHLRIDSLTTHFKYEVSQTVKDTSQAQGQGQLQAGTTGLLSKFLNVSLSGSISKTTTDESTSNRSGVLEITVHASEAPLPAGLEKLLTVLGKAVEVTEKK